MFAVEIRWARRVKVQNMRDLFGQGCFFHLYSLTCNSADSFHTKNPNDSLLTTTDITPIKVDRGDCKFSDYDIKLSKTGIFSHLIYKKEVV